MLVSLYIKGLAVIDELSIDLSPGLNVITGETGAGKSILIKALSLLLGQKASSDVIRKGQESAIVSAVFRLQSDHPAVNELIDRGTDLELSEDIVIKRKINHKSRSQAWINGEPIALGTLKSVGDKMVDIFGQHENHRLLDTGCHASYLESVSSCAEAMSKYNKLFEHFNKLFKELKDSISYYQSKEVDRDYFEYRKAELDQFGPDCTDMKQHEKFLESSRDQIDKFNSLKHAQDILDEGYNGQSLSEGLALASDILAKDSCLSELEDQARQIEDSLEGLSFRLGKELSKVEVSEIEVEQSRERLSQYRDLINKMGVKNVEELCKSHDELAKILDYLDSAKGEIKQNAEDLSAIGQLLLSAGGKLKNERRKAFQLIRKMIKSELDQLNMPGADLALDEVSVESKSPSVISEDLFDADFGEKIKVINSVKKKSSVSGLDKVQFLLRSNPGDCFHPLNKIASGGEISRIMLGMKKVLSEGAQTCVMVFDEIDTGISGQTANKVGQKLYQIASQFQVICISHLPQVAVYADRHFRIYKEPKCGQVESTVSQMNSEESLEEIARLLSSGEVTKSSIENARQLLLETTH